MQRRNAYCSFCRKSYLDVGPLVEGPGDVYVCGECVELCQSIIEQEKRRRLKTIAAELPSPQTIEQSLNRIIFGQTAVANTLAITVHAHYQRFAEEQGVPSRNNDPILLVGTTRSSRLLWARVLAHALDVPFGHRKDYLIETRSADAESPLFTLLKNADFDVASAQRGIVFIDGIDQPSARQPFLDLLAGRIEAPLQKLPFEVDGILFLCGGAFEGLDEQMARRGRHPEQPIAAADLIAFGMPVELANRFQTILSIGPMGEETTARLVSCVDLASVLNQ